MEKQALINDITREVLKILQASGSTGSSGSQATIVCEGTQADCTDCKLCVTVSPEAVKKILNGGASRVSSTVGVVNVPADVGRYIDHTLLKPEAEKSQVEKLCEEAAEFNFYSVCVNSFWVDLCARKLRGKDVKVCSVVGFPLGAMDSRSKAFETRDAIENGASEIDMVLNVGALKSGMTDVVEKDVRAVYRACRSTTVLKVIIETCLLTDDEKVLACQISKNAGADYVKTSTGFNKGGATAEDIALMRRVVGPQMGIKASGGVRTYDDAKLMIQSGATRIGASASVKIVGGGDS
jgi:deoxyribose-phosphate aldolase